MVCQMRSLILMVVVGDLQRVTLHTLLSMVGGLDQLMCTLRFGFAQRVSSVNQMRILVGKWILGRLCLCKDEHSLPN